MPHSSSETLVDYLNGELLPEADAAVYAHVAECSRCREEYEIERSIREALFESGRRSERELPESLVAAIWATAHPAQPSPLALLLRSKLLVPALGGLLSVGLGLALFTGYLPSHGFKAMNRPQIEAATFLDHHSDASMEMPLADRGRAPTFESAAESGEETYTQDS
jgi:anti-sigma factor RsiW